MAWPKTLGVNCRYGPGKVWEAVSSLPSDTRTEIKGRTVDSAWWYVSDPLNLDAFCWVAYDVVDTAGNLNIVPIVEPPSASVTNLTVEALVTFVVCGDSNPVTFNGTIKTNGPATVTYRWEVSGDVQETLSEASLSFAQAGTQNVTSSAFSADCGDYAVTLRVSVPEETSAERRFSIPAP